MASITMSASSSELEVVGPGAGGWVGSAPAVPIANAESPITAPTNAGNNLRIAILLLASAGSIFIAAQLDSPRS
jgi:hypothetical protein